MVLDNAQCHSNWNYFYVSFIFLPAKITSYLQPADAGYIAEWKQKIEKIIAMRMLDV